MLSAAFIAYLTFALVFVVKRDRGSLPARPLLVFGSRRYSGSGTGPGESANSSAFASANQTADEGACSSSATDFHDVALGVAFAFGKIAAGC